MKKGLAVLAGVVILGGMVVSLNLGESVPVSDLRAARLSECPPEEEAQEKCPAGLKDVGEFCLCYTNRETLPNEKTEGDYRCDVCEVTDPEAGKHLVVRYPKSAEPLGKDCITVANDLLLPGLSFHNLPTGIEAKLEVACAPCKIGPDSWGPCPECAFRGNCAQLCPVEE
jgi:hypothetical protein